VDSHFSSLRNIWAFTLLMNFDRELVERINWVLLGRTFNECFVKEGIDLVLRFGNTYDLVNKSTILNQETDRNGLDLQHLGEFLPLVNVNVEIFHSTITVFDSFSHHRLENLARVAPRSTGLNENWLISLLESSSPILDVSHFFDVIRLLIVLCAEHSHILVNNWCAHGSVSSQRGRRLFHSDHSVRVG